MSVPQNAVGAVPAILGLGKNSVWQRNTAISGVCCVEGSGRGHNTQNEQDFPLKQHANIGQIWDLKRNPYRSSKWHYH